MTLVFLGWQDESAAERIAEAAFGPPPPASASAARGGRSGRCRRATRACSRSTSRTRAGGRRPSSRDLGRARGRRLVPAGEAPLLAAPHARAVKRASAGPAAAGRAGAARRGLRRRGGDPLSLDPAAAGALYEPLGVRLRAMRDPSPTLRHRRRDPPAAVGAAATSRPWRPPARTPRSRAGPWCPPATASARARVHRRYRLGPGGGRELSLAILDRDDQRARRDRSLRASTGSTCKAEIGYWMARRVTPARHGRGRRACCRCGRSTSWPSRRRAAREPGERASQRVAERAGFAREGTLRRYRSRHGVREDLVMFSLLDLEEVVTAASRTLPRWSSE